MEYPIGNNILVNLATIHDMANSIYLVIDEYYKKSEFKRIILFCRGSSGAIIAGIVSSKLIELFPDKAITIHHIKKQGEESHSFTFPEDSVFYKSIILIVDDFIATGSTMRAILEHIALRRRDQEIDILCVSGNLQGSDFPTEKIKHCILSR